MSCGVMCDEVKLISVWKRFVELIKNECYAICKIVGKLIVQSGKKSCLLRG